MVKINLAIIFSKILQIPVNDVDLTISTLDCSLWDSISHNSIISEIEAQTNIYIDAEAASEMLSMLVIIEILTRKYGFVQDNTDHFLLVKGDRNVI